MKGILYATRVHTSAYLCDFFIYRAIQARRIAIQSYSHGEDHSNLTTCSTVEEMVLFAIVWIFFLSTLPRYVNTITLCKLKEKNSILFLWLVALIS